jgi:hypothetical protein
MVQMGRRWAAVRAGAVLSRSGEVLGSTIMVRARSRQDQVAR